MTERGDAGRMIGAPPHIIAGGSVKRRRMLDVSRRSGFGIPCGRPGLSRRADRVGPQPADYVTQAPGDAANILSFTERTSNTLPGFNTINQMGKVSRYDVNTRQKTVVPDLSAREVQDAGLQTIAVLPRLQYARAPTYRKMYVSSAERGTTALNRVEEYALGPNGTFGSPRVVLQYRTTPGTITR
jgi:hypothetical protein